MDHPEVQNRTAAPAKSAHTHRRRRMTRLAFLSKNGGKHQTEMLTKDEYGKRKIVPQIDTTLQTKDRFDGDFEMDIDTPISDVVAASGTVTVTGVMNDNTGNLYTISFWDPDSTNWLIDNSNFVCNSKDSAGLWIWTVTFKPSDTGQPPGDFTFEISATHTAAMTQSTIDLSAPFTLT